MSVACFPKQNQVLAAVPENCYARLLPDLERIEMPLGKVLHEYDTDLSHVYFPTTSIVSMLQVMDDAACAGIAMVGSEALVGLALFIGDAVTPNRAVVQCAGEGYRIKSQFMRGEIDRAGPVLDLLLIHTRALIAQMVNTAACNRHHSLEQRFCRWLLSTLDRHSSKRIGITQELLADVLGARRESIGALVRQLGGDGLIRHSGHWIELRDRAEVEARACECYALLTMEVDRLLTRAIKQ
ncbi:MAG: helix-turn-helix domain-containing protein [Betaproteobacteria bacterium]|nr:helix-turn-helix domain-containing protein [Betaproteobacteria bacterium]